MVGDVNALSRGDRSSDGNEMDRATVKPSAS